MIDIEYSIELLGGVDVIRLGVFELVHSVNVLFTKVLTVGSLLFIVLLLPLGDL